MGIIGVLKIINKLYIVIILACYNTIPNITCKKEKVMLIQHEREKLLNVIAYFANNVSKLGKVKLIKLLYFLDFEHYRQTGRSVTGLDYYAWEMGPVPNALYEEINNPKPDMASMIEFTVTPTTYANDMLKIEAIKDYNPKLFSRRELRIMAELAKEYQDSTASTMIDQTHQTYLPWHKVFVEDHCEYAKIPYTLILTGEDKETILAIAKERQEFIDHYSYKSPSVIPKSEQPC